MLEQLLKQNRRQKVVNRGDLRLCGGLYVRAGGGLTFKFDKISLTSSVSYFNLGVEISLGG